MKTADEALYRNVSQGHHAEQRSIEVFFRM
jgi:ribosome maturation protein Sdo1